MTPGVFSSTSFTAVAQLPQVIPSICRFVVGVLGGLAAVAPGWVRQRGTTPAAAIALNKTTNMSLFMAQLSLMDYPRTHPDHVGKVRTMMATAAAIQSTMRLKRCTLSTPRVAHIEPGSHTSAGRFRYVM